MARKAKFSPLVTKIKLNPEQAVLTCDCSGIGLRGDPQHLFEPTGTICYLSGPSYKDQRAGGLVTPGGASS